MFSQVQSDNEPAYIWTTCEDLSDCSYFQAQRWKMCSFLSSFIKVSFEPIKWGSISIAMPGRVNGYGIAIQCNGEIHVQIWEFGENFNWSKQQTYTPGWQQGFHYYIEERCGYRGIGLCLRVDKAKGVWVKKKIENNSFIRLAYRIHFY